MTDQPGLIEYGFSLKQASLDSVHEKKVRYGHISTLHCDTPRPRLVRVQDPFGSLLARVKGSVLISPARVMEAGEA